MHELYPITICADRYNGTYSHGRWLAFNMETEEIPEDIAGDDTECMNFWYEFEGIVGCGDTPDLALKNLIEKKEANDTNQIW